MQRELLYQPPETSLATNTAADHALSQSAANAAGTATSPAALSAAGADNDTSTAAAKSDVVDSDSFDTSLHPATPDHGQLPQKPVLLDWRLLLRVVRVWQIWYLACTEAVKGEAAIDAWVGRIDIWLGLLCHSEV